MTLWRQLEAWVQRAPATYVYLFTLTVTTWVLQTASGPVAHRLLAEQSTNIERLEHDALHVLVSSAFWVARPVDLAVWAVAFTIVLAPAERWIGTRWWLLTFAIGHVGATLASQGIVWAAIQADALPERVRRVQDVGASYGFFALAALLTFALPARRLRLLYTAALWTAAGLGAVFVDVVADAGHGAAILLGYLCWLVYGRPGSASRGSWPSATSAATPARGRPSRLSYRK